MLEKFYGGVEEPYVDVNEQLGLLDGDQRKALELMVACDRVWGFFEDRRGVTNSPRLTELIRKLAIEIGFEVNKSGEMTGEEAKEYLDLLMRTDLPIVVEEMGEKDVYYTIWEKLSVIARGE